MEHSHWHKQGSEPLYPDLIWAKPESKQSAGKLLIIGGNVHGFSAVGQAFTSAQKAGIGQVRVVLPDVLQKTVSKLMPEAFFAPSTPSGSFSQRALADFIDQAAWADGVLIAGDLGRNSETAIVLEKFASKYNGQLTLTKDAADYFTKTAIEIINRPDTTLVISLVQLQQLAKSVNSEKPFTFDMNLINLVDALHEFTARFKINIVLKHLDTIFIVVNGLVSTTKTANGDEDSWRVPTASAAAVWWLQNSSKTFEALTSSLF